MAARARRPRLDLVAGARPNFMKLAPIWAALARGKRIAARWIHTGQHGDPAMDAAIVEASGLPPPDRRLAGGTGPHGQQTAAILEAFEAHLLVDPPDGVVVVGDVNGTLACALAAAKQRIPVAHVEAGLRSGDRDMPEEVNRVVVGALADLHLATEPVGKTHLRAAGVPASRIVVAGNPMADQVRAVVRGLGRRRASVGIGLPRKGYALATLHRAAHVDDEASLAAWRDRLHEVARTMPVCWLVHPRTAAHARRWRLVLNSADVRVLPPQPHEQALALARDAALVVTDSGGLPTECAVLRVPCASLRDNLEHEVPVQTGAVRLVGDSKTRLARAVRDATSGTWGAIRTSRWLDGKAGPRIARALEGWAKGLVAT